MRVLTLLVLLVVACATELPTVDAWTRRVWTPMVQSIPTPEEVTRSACESSLETLRERAVELDPAPSEELADAAHGWLEAAESLMFTCVSEPDLDYRARYERLLLRRAEVEVVLEGS